MNKGPALDIHLTNGWFIVTFDYGVLDDLYNGEAYVRVDSEGKIYHVNAENIVCVKEVPDYVRD